MLITARNTLALLLVTAAAHTALAQTQAPAAPASTPAQPAPKPTEPSKPEPLPTYTQTMPVSRYQLTFVKIPAQVETVERTRPGTRGDEPGGTIVAEQTTVETFYLSTTEVTWDCLDPFVYRLDLENPDAEVDATTRPSKPYIPPDRGFGHENFPAISITFRTADAYCQWLTEKTGLKFRLPTDQQWEHAATATREPHLITDLTKAQIDALAWHEGNAEGQTHAVKSRQPNPWGLYDMLGNAGEWTTASDNTPRLRGGSYKTPLDKLTISLSEKQDPSWNASDPQIPKSKWWLPDAPFTGFRLILECDPKTGEPLKAKPDATPDTKPTAPSK